MINISVKLITDLIFRAGQALARQLVIFIPSLVLIKYINEIEYGKFSLILGVLILCVSLGDFGISSIAMREISKSKSIENSKIIFTNSLLFSISFSILLFVIGGIYLSFYEDSLYLIILAPIAILAPFYTIIDANFRANLNFKPIFYKTITSLIVSLISQYLLFMLFGIKGIFMGMTIFYLTFLAINLAQLSENIAKNIKLKLFIPHAVSGAYIGFATLGYMMYTKFNVIILNSKNMVIELGFYELIDKIFNFALYPFAIIAQVFAPRIAFSKNNRLKELYKYSIPIVFFTALIFGVLVKKISEFYFSNYQFNSGANRFLLLGLEFSVYLFPIKVLSVFQNQTFFIMHNFEKNVFVFYIITGIVNLFLTVILLRYFGFSGVYISNLISLSISVLCQTIYFYYTKFKL